jgi:hypothetical protein
MDRLTGEFTAKSPVDKLVLPYPVETCKGAGHHLHLKMISTTGEILDLDDGIGQGTPDGSLNLIRLHHGKRRRAEEI